jgi:acetoin utilization deacetylase AcuC-like enzyme
MKAFYHDHFVFPLPEGHRFPMSKYALLRGKILSEGLLSPEDLIVPEAASDEELLRVHKPDYVNRVATGKLSAKEMRRIGFPWSPQLVERSRRSVGGTIAACRTALREGWAVNLAGGTHHAYPDHGEGYCIFNDIAVAGRAVQAEGGVKRIVILDCDVHQGNGTAAIFKDDPSVFTFSIHGAKNFPFRKETSDLDMALEDGTEDEAYLETLQGGVKRSLELAKADLAIYVSGADPYSGDRLGRLALTKAGLAERDRIVFEACWKAGLPQATVMAGGYARDVHDTVDIHYQTIRTAVRMAERMNGRVRINL